MRRLSVILTAAATILMLAACAGGSSPAPSTSSAPAASTAASAAASGTAAACAVAPGGSTATVSVTIKDFKFAPDPIQAKVGDVIGWTNNDSTAHTATLEDNSCSTDPIQPGATGELTFSAPGTYTYKCRIHPTQMKGYTIKVT
jgi:plastocyanin